MRESVNPAMSPRGIRQRNSVAALQALFDHGSLSRADLARLIGLNRSSSGNIVAELAASGLVREATGDDGRRSALTRSGRPGIMLELDPAAACFLGAEIGVEHLTTAQIDLAAEVVKVRVEPFDGRAVPVEAAVARALEQALDGLGREQLDRVEGIGLAAPAQMDHDGRVTIAPILGWRDVDLTRIAREASSLDVAIMVENEANAFAFGESYRNPDARAGVTLFLVLETGVGGGIVIDGSLLRGAHGLAGEIGHVPAFDGHELEQRLGLGYLLRRSAEGLGATSLRDFLEAVRDRVPAAVTVAEDWARELAWAIATASRLIDPGRVVLGGSVSALYPLVAARVGHHLRTLQAPTFPEPRILVHEAAEAGAAFGAACMLHRRFIAMADGPLAVVAGPA